VLVVVALVQVSTVGWVPEEPEVPEDDWAVPEVPDSVPESTAAGVPPESLLLLHAAASAAPEPAAITQIQTNVCFIRCLRGGILVRSRFAR
jgi:hypothetical protein